MLKKLLCILGLHYHCWATLKDTDSFIISNNERVWVYICPWCSNRVYTHEYHSEIL